MFLLDPLDLTKADLSKQYELVKYKKPIDVASKIDYRTGHQFVVILAF
jgi:hypothetical protein